MSNVLYSKYNFLFFVLLAAYHGNYKQVYSSAVNYVIFARNGAKLDHGNNDLGHCSASNC